MSGTITLKRFAAVAQPAREGVAPLPYNTFDIDPREYEITSENYGSPLLWNDGVRSVVTMTNRETGLKESFYAAETPDQIEALIEQSQKGVVLPFISPHAA